MTNRNKIFLCPALLSLAVLSAVSLVHGAEADSGVNIDAAFYSAGSLYLIKGGEYVTLVDGKERTISSTTNLGLPQDATVHAVIDVDDGPAFFYTDENGVYHHDAYSKVPDLIKAGIDAAGDRLGTHYFFKGCEQVSRWADYNMWLRARQIEKGLPCDMDAAWSEGNELIALKDDQIWTWGPRGVTGPTPFKNRYELKSWKLINYYRLKF